MQIGKGKKNFPAVGRSVQVLKLFWRSKTVGAHETYIIYKTILLLNSFAYSDCTSSHCNQSSSSFFFFFAETQQKATLTHLTCVLNVKKCTKIWVSYYWSKRNLETTSILMYVLAPSAERSNTTTHRPFSRVRLILLCELLFRQQMRAITQFHENKFTFAYCYHLVPHTCENYIFFSSVYKYYGSFKKLARWIIPSGIRPATLDIK